MSIVNVNALLGQRYGASAPVLVDPALSSSETLGLLLRHRSVRAFTRDEVSDEHVTAIIAAAQSAASSSNNQSWSVVEVRDRDRLRRLVTEAGGSDLIAEAPVVLLFIADWSRASDIARWHDEPAGAAAYLESTLVGFVDAGIAAQSAVVAAEALGLGTVYLGSLRNHPEVTAAEIGLPQGAAVAFGVAIGWPDPTDTAGIKPRLAQSAVRSRETYRPIAREDVEAYEGELAAYNASQGRGGSWTRQVVARVRDVRGLNGRENARAALEQRGLPSQ
ncbi:nitroreductase [Microbacterium terrae]|uniref:FMN reductase [NAD(P)H] n=1 Tax=Microbacterium terrae TaxID=69369 RepID=A0A0M2H4F8_9MICO|nr:nitroreductase family protein [Microbacterium terrae]KJL38741.1 FMN reductase [NAD(P)H] [Microbacterium terrae]MBP1076160.1 nitroreductase [Microbacterium terrae]GLJ96980.1 NADPH-dependent oxidoreductase [Microbacterium terrae]